MESSSIFDWHIGHVLEITSDRFVATNIVSDLEPMNLTYCDKIDIKSVVYVF